MDIDNGNNERGINGNLVPNSERTPEWRKEIARMGGVASGESRRRRKSLREALELVLDEPVSPGSEKTRLDAIVVRALKKLYDNPTMKDVKILAEVLGELKISLEHTGMAINIQTSEEGKECIEKILEGEDD